MKVMFQSRRNLFSVPGGDTTQILKTAEYLEKLGVKVDITTELEPNVKEYDIVHIFNLMRPQETYIQTLNAKKQEKPVVLSTIYGLYTEYEQKASGGLRQMVANMLSPYQIEYLKILGRAVKNKETHKGVLRVLVKGYFRTLKEICSMIDVFLPNSKSEMYRVVKDFKLRSFKYVIVPNAVDINLYNYDKVKVKREIEDKYKDCILCVAKISGRKNQLNLVKAVKDLPYKLVLIGYPPPNHSNYFKKVIRESGKNVVFLGKKPHEELPQYYKVAKVHVLPSWMETPGLVSLEAAVMRCNIVVTKKGDTEEYFKNFAFYCDPGNPYSIKKAIIEAYNTPFNEKFREYILKNFTWEKAAERTLEGYMLALKYRDG